MMIFQISRLGSIGLQFKYHLRVYLDDTDDFYFGVCQKILKIQKVRSFGKNKNDIFLDFLVKSGNFPKNTEKYVKLLCDFL